MEYKDYYKILGVDRSASDKEIKEAYRKFARKYHPDVNPGDAGANEKFKEINEAYQVLSDKEKRSRYDNLGENWQYYGNQSYGGSPQGQPASPRNKNFEDVHVEFSDLGGGFSDFFKTFFAQSGPLFTNEHFEYPSQGSSHSYRGQDAEVELDVTLEESYKGDSKVIELQIPKMCPACGGKRLAEGKACERCHGTGVVEHSKRLQVKIPVGAFDGMKIRLGGQGFENGNGRKGKHGDLYLFVKVLPHPLFERKGDDIYGKVPVPVWDAVLGGEVKVETLKGKMLLKLPVETQNGKVFRLEKCGMPRMNGSGFGDHYAEIKINVPEKLTSDEKQLFMKLKELRIASVS